MQKIFIITTEDVTRVEFKKREKKSIKLCRLADSGIIFF